MIIDFRTMPETVLHHFKGGEGDTLSRMFTNELGKIMLSRLQPGCTIGYHAHETSSEIIYILSGQADFLYDDGTETVPAGGCHYCPKGHSHSMINNSAEDIVFFAVVPEQ